MAESIHNKLKRVRKPRVHITYDVETNGAVSKKEIPFVMGVMGDYSGDNTENKKALKDRKFSQIDRDNFNEIMAKTAPKLDLKVDNTMEGDGSEMSVNLDFKHMEDFEPHKIVDQVEPLRKLMETRNKLRDLLSKADRSEELEDLLEEILSNTETIASLSGELGIDKEEGDK
ncbi:type VI secretion system contractile sheath small subunit [Aliikangiella coralliicola]|uniref:Type VI secretion system contractile sheath small subunit n=1 Tax=Aliikangiella coralliicola TaxID=2592383 RepID=A0A545U8R7_9GAMM|nr:type VI secretion system contractile sheath small subunit [Aliikangiella coralliicola]TQV85867.1 type VI secretion system contractile sheath small subunit [Aliikangiella coralliicola]